LPLSVIFFASVSPLHFRVQLESGLQLTEQEPSQTTLQVEPALQDTLPLSPTVTLQVDFSQLTLPLVPRVSAQVLELQSALHDLPQLPAQSLPFWHFKEQLVPAVPPQLLTSHSAP
jgi:hypothetical protein